MDFEGLKAWLNAQMTSCGAKRDELTRDGRGDEANFEKIRANVFEIFLTVLDVAGKTCPDEAAKTAFFQSRLAQIPKSWYDALEKATAHGDDARACIERVKIDALEQIQNAFLHGAGEQS